MQRTLANAVAAAAIACVLGAGVPGQTLHASVAPGQAEAQKQEGAKAYFDRARKLGFPSSGQTQPYILRAEFTARANSGAVDTGIYTDTWLSDSKWRREATLGKSIFVRSRSGKKRYRLADGPDAPLLQFVLTAMEPIPESSSVDESEWRIKHQVVDGVSTTCVSKGNESADGTPDGSDFEAYWFDQSGELVKSSLNGLETRRSDFSNFNGVQVARKVEVVLKGKVGMQVEVNALGPAGKVDSHIFTIQRHEWTPEALPEAR
jgi:hypothetical protein